MLNTARACRLKLIGWVPIVLKFLECCLRCLQNSVIMFDGHDFLIKGPYNHLHFVPFFQRLGSSILMNMAGVNIRYWTFLETHRVTQPFCEKAWMSHVQLQTMRT